MSWTDATLHRDTTTWAWRYRFTTYHVYSFKKINDFDALTDRTPGGSGAELGLNLRPLGARIYALPPMFLIPTEAHREVAAVGADANSAAG